MLLLTGCSPPGPTPEQTRADILRRMPANVADRQGWAADIQSAFAAQEIAPTPANVCAVLAVVEQESTFQADPPVPGLGRIAYAEILRRAAAKHVPEFVVRAALQVRSPDGRTYDERLQHVRTEKQLSDLFEALLGSVPLGAGRLLAGLNPVHTAGPMQVSIAFAQAHARGYPYPREGSMRHEVFTRRGGLYFGIQHLLGYRAPYDAALYRFADFNAGWYASRNAAFQSAVMRAGGGRLALDGDLLAPGAKPEAAGATERAVRALRPRLDLDDAAIRRALAQAESPDFAVTDLYRQVFALADARAGKPVPRALVPSIDLHSPKLSRRLTTAWFADRVNARWHRCMRR